MTHLTGNGIDIAVLAGRLVMADVSQVRQRLLTTVEQGKRKLVLDLSEVAFMDSSGLSVLVSVFKAARLKNGEVVLLHPNPTVRSLIELTRLQQIFAIFDDENGGVGPFALAGTGWRVPLHARADLCNRPFRTGRRRSGCYPCESQLRPEPLFFPRANTVNLYKKTRRVYASPTRPCGR
ncbi:MAG: STAS domain-containing protein [Candidatus Moduliflexus flocculans]|nr:STAS domain-containing protein [Candidatus Moduliflexus flocculans]